MKLLDNLKTPVPEHLPEGKSRVTYTFLAYFFGQWGIHNSWAGGPGFAEKGKAQLLPGLIGCCPCCLGIPGILSWISAVKDAATVK